MGKAIRDLEAKGLRSLASRAAGSHAARLQQQSDRAFQGAGRAERSARLSGGGLGRSLLRARDRRLTLRGLDKLSAAQRWRHISRQIGG